MNLPEELDGARVICYARITASVTRTGHTRHWVDGRLLGAPHSLAICQYTGCEEFYLFYCDENWTVLTDTLHTDLDEAKQHAEFEYAGITTQWKQTV